MSEGREIPYSTEAEEAEVGGLLLDPEGMSKVRDWLQPYHFYRERARTIYGVMCELYDSKQPIDYVTVVNRLEEAKKLDDVGGAAYLMELVANTPSAMYLKHYADIVVKLAEQRALIAASQEIVQLGFDSEFDRTHARDKALNAVMRALPHKVDNSWMTMGQALSGALSQLDPVTRTPPIPTGFRRLDAQLGGGLYRKRSYVVAGRPGMGKSAFMLGLALTGAEAGAKTAFFSLEMTAEELMLRALAMYTGINGLKLASGNINPDSDEMERVLEAADKLNKLPIKFNPFFEVNAVFAACAAQKAEEGLDAVYVDYLQLLEIDGMSGDNRNLEIGKITRRGKNMAKDLDLALIFGSQLSRVNEHAKDKRPDLSALRDSGSIEQDQDAVFGLYREEYYSGQDAGKAEVILLKHRQGPTGTIVLNYEKQTTKFTDGRF